MSRADEIAELKKRELEIKERRKALEQKERARRRTEERKADTRRKILVGSFMIEELLGGDDKAKAYLARIIDARAVKERDREVLSPLYKELTGKDLVQPSLSEPTVMLASEAEPDGEVMAS